MDDSLVCTPVPRAGPNSRLLRRQSGLPDPRTDKESNLQRSLNLLDQALGSPIHPVGRRDLNLDMTADLTRQVDSSRLANLSRVMDVTRHLTQPIKFGLEMTGSLHPTLLEENPGVKGTENLLDDFMSVSSSGDQGLDTIAEFEQMVGDHVYTLRRVVANLPKQLPAATAAVLEHLVNERNTWRIMGKLYTDRLITCKQPPPSLPPPAPGSEKQIIERFFMNNHEVRQTYMVVEWLEKMAQDEMEQTITQQMEWFSDATICWENTTAALSRGQVGAHMVKELDPDAPNRTGLQLHDLDQQDEVRLLTCVYGLVRCGLLEDAQELCVRLGQPWRAATLEGWKLFHDPNYGTGTDGRGDKLPVEGNKHRDVWKKVAWGLTTDSSLFQYERSTYAALCGNLQQLRALSASWEDKVWAGAKCAVDIMVETEIRSNLAKSFAEMPTEYWNTPSSLSKILSEASGKGSVVFHQIQTHLILDEYPVLVDKMLGWVQDHNIEAHLLRLLAHLVLINRSLGLEVNRDKEEKILVEYTRFLMREERLMLVPWYVSRLSQHIQIPLYSQFLAGVHNHDDQALCLSLGREVNLDMKTIVVEAVSSVRKTSARDNDQMVSSLGWLCHDPSQAPDLLYQTNAVIRKLLAVGQIELAAQAAGKIPKETLNLVVKVWRNQDGGQGLPGGAVREYLALKVYLEAQDAFSDWFDHFHRGQPKRPALPANPSFTEKVAHEQREKQFMAELDRWRGGQIIQSRHAEEKLREVINFPGGWLLDVQEEEDEEGMRDEEEEERRQEIANLRGELLPQTLLLLHSVLHNTGQYAACVALANLIADEHTRNYVAFSKEKIKQILAKIRESSLAVLDEGKDPWGFHKP